MSMGNAGLLGCARKSELTEQQVTQRSDLMMSKNYSRGIAVQITALQTELHRRLIAGFCRNCHCAHKESFTSPPSNPPSLCSFCTLLLQNRLCKYLVLQGIGKHVTTSQVVHLVLSSQSLGPKHGKVTEVVTSKTLCKLHHH